MTFTQAVSDLAAGRTTSRDLVETCLNAAADPAGEGARVFIRLYADQARASADAMDALRRVGRAPGPLAGIPISIKDLFDVAGEVTTAGSTALADAAPAKANAAVIDRVLAAGLIPVGRTNMSEFAFSGIGLNPHYGTPRGPWDRGAGHVPGGSSSGAAVSVSDGMALAALGTDTGGSCRIPAAFCGVVGYKPTARRVSTQGAFPLSTTLDSIGPLAPTVACCALMDAVLAGTDPAAPTPLPLAGVRLAVPTTIVLDGMDAVVAALFERALQRLAAAGASISHIGVPPFTHIQDANLTGGFPAVEAFAVHRHLLAALGGQYDPNVRTRIERGRAMAALDYVDLLAARRRIRATMDALTADFSAVVMPTVPIVPPLIDALADPAVFSPTNLFVLRNNALGNFLDRCAISLPCQRPGDPPVGLMLMGETGGDTRLFALAAAVEAALKE